MQYFRRTDFDAYSVLLVRLGLKDSFVKLVRNYNAPPCHPSHVKNCFFYSAVQCQMAITYILPVQDRFMLQHQESLDYKQKKSRKK